MILHLFVLTNFQLKHFIKNKKMCQFASKFYMQFMIKKLDHHIMEFQISIVKIVLNIKTD